MSNMENGGILWEYDDGILSKLIKYHGNMMGFHKYDDSYWGFQKNGRYPKMDGLYNGKSHLEMDELGVPL